MTLTPCLAPLVTGLMFFFVYFILPIFIGFMFKTIKVMIRDVKCIKLNTPISLFRPIPRLAFVLLIGVISYAGVSKLITNTHFVASCDEKKETKTLAMTVFDCDCLK